MPSSAFDSLSPVTNQLPLLRELSLGTGDQLSGSNSSTVRAMFHHAPQLHSLECVNFRPFQFIIPWAQLREIPVMSAPLQECHEVLSRSFKLEEATLIPISGPLISMPVSQSTTVIRLTLLSDPWNVNVSVAPFFEKLSAPKLVFLKLVELRFISWHPLPLFLTRSTALSILELRRTYIPPQGFIQCLQSIPTLVRLVVEPVPFGPLLFNNQLLSEFTFHHSENSSAQPSCLIPKLTDLALILNAMPFTMSFLEMVESRFLLEQASEGASAVSRIRRVRVKTAVEIEAEVDTRLSALRGKGLNIVVGSNAYA